MTRINSAFHGMVVKYRTCVSKLHFAMWQTYSMIRYPRAVFIDTSLVQGNCVDTIAYLNRATHISNTVVREVECHGLKLPRKMINVDYFSLMKDCPGLCPVFSNFFSLCYNPAVIGSTDFIDNLFLAKKLRNQLKKDEEKIFWDQHSLSVGIQTTEVYDLPKGRKWEIIDHAHKKHFRKKRREKDGRHYYNDILTFLSALLYGLKHRSNIVIETADSDFLMLALSWTEGCVQQQVFSTFILSSLSDNERRILASRKTIAKELSMEEYVERYQDTFRDFIGSKWWVRDHISFSIRYFDHGTKKSYLFKLFHFNNDLIELLLNMHGPLLCPFASNMDMGKWIRYTFQPPSNATDNVIRFKVTQKDTVQMDRMVAQEIHIANCRFANDNANNNFNEYFGFK